ncbi:hypothetical protein DPMN_142004 [Dreissena polymorpha]|uniref:Uncharacterized protein n=1 Tax=Dreissena polymorpha TaxID=45954 RepID=A0A9D4JLT2_DREPO|nr:hypothetical protein DPMN_142004 [Dreissena polymorpha]
MVVHILTATEEELRELPEVGPKTAGVREKHKTMTPDLLSLAMGRTIPWYLLDLVEFPEAAKDFKSVVSDDLAGQPSAEQFVLSLPQGASGVQEQFPDKATPAEVKLDVAASPLSNLAVAKLVQGQQPIEQDQNLQSRQGERPSKPYVYRPGVGHPVRHQSGSQVRRQE